MKRFDALVLGGGPAGYAAALRLAAGGKSVALFEKKRLGGACLHVGCIPTKFLQAAAVRYADLGRLGKDFGVSVAGAKLDFPALVARLRRTVGVLEKGIESRLREAGVTVVQGEAEAAEPGLVRCRGEEYAGGALLLATGSSPRRLPAFPPGPGVVTSDELLSEPRLPVSLLVLGAGVVGLEFACLYAQLGVRVRLVDVAPSILPGLDVELGELLLNSLRRLGVAVELASPAPAPKDEELVLVAVGRRPNVESAGVEVLGLPREGDRLKVDGRLRAGAPGVYALGDLSARFAYAHTAYEHARIACADLLGEGREDLDETTVPHGIFTTPEIAAVGATEAEARAAGREVRVVKRAFAGLGKARLLGETQGFMKIVADAGDGRILGVHLAGPSATDLIGEACVLVRKGCTLGDLERVVHPHPTLAEIFGFP